MKVRSSPRACRRRDELVVLAGVPRHLEGVVQEGRVEPRVVGRFLEDLQHAEGLLVRRDDRGEEREVVGEVGGRDRPGLAGAAEPGGRSAPAGPAAAAAAWKTCRRTSLWHCRPPRLGVEADLVEVDLAGDLEEPLRGAQPDRAGRGVDGREGAVEELLVELGGRQVRAGQLGRGLERLFDRTAVAVFVFGHPGRVGTHLLSSQISNCSESYFWVAGAGKAGRTGHRDACGRGGRRETELINSSAEISGEWGFRAESREAFDAEPPYSGTILLFFIDPEQSIYLIHCCILADHGPHQFREGHPAQLDAALQ